MKSERPNFHVPESFGWARFVNRPPVKVEAYNEVAPGELVVERPTLICLGFEWPVSGDDNRNSTVEVSYRKASGGEWRTGMPLLRMGGEKVVRPDLGLDYTVPEMFAGSLLLLAFGVAPGAAIGAIVVFLGYGFVGWLAVIPAAALVAGLIVGEIILAVHVLGAVLDRTDPTAVDSIS